MPSKLPGAINRAIGNVDRIDCLLKDPENARSHESATERINQAREDLSKLKGLLHTAKRLADASSKRGLAKGVRAKAAVFAGRQEVTQNNVKKEHLQKSKRGKVVTKAASAAGAAKYKHIAPWNEALSRSRRSLNVQGFCPIGGKTARGKELLKAARKELARMKRYES